MKYKYDFHVHDNYSYDSYITSTELLDRFRNSNLDKIALTNHDVPSTYYSKKSSNRIIPGYEKTLEDNTHLLVLFSTIFIEEMDFYDFINKVKETSQEAVIIMPHPYRTYSGALRNELHLDQNEILSRIDIVDAIEVINGKSTFEENMRAVKLWESHNFDVSAGSDSHNGNMGTVHFSTKIEIIDRNSFINANSDIRINYKGTMYQFISDNVQNTSRKGSLYNDRVLTFYSENKLEVKSVSDMLYQIGVEHANEDGFLKILKRTYPLFHSLWFAHNKSEYRVSITEEVISSIKYISKKYQKYSKNLFIASSDRRLIYQEDVIVDRQVCSIDLSRKQISDKSYLSKYFNYKYKRNSAFTISQKESISRPLFFSYSKDRLFVTHNVELLYSDNRLNDNSVYDSFKYGYLRTEESLLENIYTFRAFTDYTFSQNKSVHRERKCSYFDNYSVIEDLPYIDVIGELSEVLLNASKANSDNGLLFLSAGRDSNAILGILNHLNINIDTYTYYSMMSGDYRFTNKVAGYDCIKNSFHWRDEISCKKIIDEIELYNSITGGIVRGLPNYPVLQTRVLSQYYGNIYSGYFGEPYNGSRLNDKILATESNDHETMLKYVHTHKQVLSDTAINAYTNSSINSVISENICSEIDNDLQNTINYNHSKFIEYYDYLYRQNRYTKIELLSSVDPEKIITPLSNNEAVKKILSLNSEKRMNSQWYDGMIKYINPNYFTIKNSLVPSTTADKIKFRIKDVYHKGININPNRKYVDWIKHITKRTELGEYIMDTISVNSFHVLKKKTIKYLGTKNMNLSDYPKMMPMINTAMSIELLHNKIKGSIK
jgi:predicted metal-dependent phosphoesterase TrpH